MTNEALILLDTEPIINEATLLKATEELAHIGSWHVNLKSGKCRWSDETYRLLGFKPGEVAPQIESFYKQIHPDDRQYFNKKIEEIETENLSSQEMELRIIDSKTRATKYVQTRLVVKRDDNGTIITRMGFNMDITSAKLAEQKLLRSQSHLIASQHVADIGSWEVNLFVTPHSYEVSIYWSDETYRIYGVSPGKFVPTLNSVLMMVHPDDRSTLFRKYTNSLETGKSYNCEYRIIRPDHSKRVLRGRGAVVIDNVTGKPTKMIGTVQDITEQKQEEMAFYESEANLRAIFDNTSAVYTLVDKNLKIVSFNNAALESFGKGLSKKLFIGAYLPDFIAEDRKQRALKMYKKVFKGEQLKVEDSFQLLDGSIIWYYMQLLPVLGKNKKVINMIMYLRNITEQKTLELKNAQTISDLTKQNKELTHMLNTREGSDKKRLVARKKTIK